MVRCRLVSSSGLGVSARAARVIKGDVEEAKVLHLLLPCRERDGRVAPGSTPRSAVALCLLANTNKPSSSLSVPSADARSGSSSPVSGWRLPLGGRFLVSHGWPLMRTAPKMRHVRWLGLRDSEAARHIDEKMAIALCPLEQHAAPRLAGPHGSRLYLLPLERTPVDGRAVPRQEQLVSTELPKAVLLLA